MTHVRSGVLAVSNHQAPGFLAAGDLREFDGVANDVSEAFRAFGGL
jgi:hypothetical protein